MGGTGNDKIQIFGQVETEALDAVDEIRLAGLDATEIAREAVSEMLRRSLSNEERIKLHQQYKRGELSKEVTQVLIRDGLDEIGREREAFRSAMVLDTDGIFRE